MTTKREKHLIDQEDRAIIQPCQACNDPVMLVRCSRGFPVTSFPAWLLPDAYCPRAVLRQESRIMAQLCISAKTTTCSCHKSRPVGVNRDLKEFSWQSLYFTASLSTPKQKYQGKRGSPACATWPKWKRITHCT